MISLRNLLVQNQTNLDRLQTRVNYVMTILGSTPPDFHRSYGPCSQYWDDWYFETESILNEMRGDLFVTEQFVDELREFVILCDKAGTPRTKVLENRSRQMYSVAREALSCQVDMIRLADDRIAKHREFTKCLVMTESIEGFGEE